MNPRRFLFLVLLVLCLASLIVEPISAQSTAAGPIRLGLGGYFQFYGGYGSEEEVNTAIDNFPHGPVYPNIFTGYAAVPAGDHKITFTVSDTEDVAPDSITTTAGHSYTLIKLVWDQPAVLIDETSVREIVKPAEGENVLIVVSQTIVEEGDNTAFRILDNESPRERPVFFYDYYAATALGSDGVTLQRFRPGEDDPVGEVVIPYFPNTDVIINGDQIGEEGSPLVLNFSTDLSVAGWLNAVNQMENPPFTFRNFIAAATHGGFYTALEKCEDYTWMPFTDSAFDKLDTNTQAQTLGARAAAAMDQSVFQPATTTPWGDGPSTTRGGTPITFLNPFASSDATEHSLSSVLMSVATRGNGVQNVLHLVDTTPTQGFETINTAFFISPP